MAHGGRKIGALLLAGTLAGCGLTDRAPAPRHSLIDVDLGECPRPAVPPAPIPTIRPPEVLHRWADAEHLARVHDQNALIDCRRRNAALVDWIAGHLDDH